MDRRFLRLIASNNSREPGATSVFRLHPGLCLAESPTPRNGSASLGRRDTGVPGGDTEITVFLPDRNAAHGHIVIGRGLDEQKIASLEQLR